MKRLLYILYQSRALLVFVGLVFASAVLIAKHRAERPHLWGTHHPIVGSVYHWLSELQAYPTLRREHDQLQQENVTLRSRLLQQADATSPAEATAKQYNVIPARVINNSIAHTKNYLTLNKGALHGIVPDMGVMSEQGVVGRVRHVSKHFATVVSVLHTDVMISAELDQTGVIGTVQWPGHNPTEACMLYVPRHATITPGEAIVTSGYNATFPKGVLIGHVKHTTLRNEAPFYDIRLALSTDFSRLKHVYVVKNAWKQEKQVLEQQTQDFYE